MAPLVEDEKLSNRRYFLAVLRLLLDEDDRLVYGEVVDEEGNSYSRFKDWRELTFEVQAYLAQRSQDTKPTQP